MGKKLKIVFLNIYQTQIDRGAETYVKELSERLGKENNVVVLHSGGMPPRRWPILWRFFIDRQGISILWWTIGLLPTLWREKFDIVFLLNGGWQVILTRIVTWLYGGKIIISGQSGKGWDDRVNLLSFPDVFVALSSQNKKWAKSFNPLVRVEYIPNGADLDKFNPGGKKSDLKLGAPIILCVGALIKNKRINLTIKAVARLKRGNLVLAGDGPLKDEIQALGNDLLGERFKYIGAVPFTNLPDVYRSADLFTLASVPFQSFEIVLVEAMATNLAVVATDDPIRREIVAGGGILVDPVDIEVYTKALEKALGAGWGNKPRLQAEKFSWDSIAEKYRLLIENIL